MGMLVVEVHQVLGCVQPWLIEKCKESLEGEGKVVGWQLCQLLRNENHDAHSDPLRRSPI